MELSIEELNKRFGTKSAVSNISVTLQPGVYGLLGANGAGKTTLMRMVCNILKPTSGRILYDGEDINRLEDNYRNLLGYLPQDFGYYPDFTAKEYLEFIAAVKGLEGKKAKKNVAQVLETVNLSDVAAKKIRTFSGGMKQRLGIAQAVINNPKILVLDEPTAALDAIAENEMYEKYNEMLTGKTALFISHRLASTRFCDHILFLENGKITEEGTHEELMQENGGYAEMFLVQSRYYKEEGAQSHEEHMAGI